ncbi:MAG: RNA methyltransferase [Pirellulaceae bacterium]
MFAPLTSPHNPRVKAAARLRDRRGRTQQQRIVIDGVRELLRAVEGGIEIDEVFVGEVAAPHLTADSDDRNASSGASDSHHPAEWRQLAERLRSSSASCFVVPPRLLEKLAFGERDSGIVATARMPRRELSELRLPADPLVVVIEGVEKPGNVGAILRTADAAGVSAVIVADGGTDLFNPNAIRASLGAIFTVPVCEADSVATRDWLESRGLRIHAARVDGAVDYGQANLAPPAAIVLGSEATGLSAVWHGSRVAAIKLPMLGHVDSLNVSTTAAILMYESLRQRQSSRTIVNAR